MTGDVTHSLTHVKLRIWLNTNLNNPTDSSKCHFVRNSTELIGLVNSCEGWIKLYARENRGDLNLLKFNPPTNIRNFAELKIDVNTACSVTQYRVTSETFCLYFPFLNLSCLNQSMYLLYVICI